MFYLVIAYRMGQSEGYHFPVGIFIDRAVAIQAAKVHHEYRGGKYDHKLFTINPEQEYDASECPSEWVTGNHE